MLWVPFGQAAIITFIEDAMESDVGRILVRPYLTKSSEYEEKAVNLSKAGNLDHFGKIKPINCKQFKNVEKQLKTCYESF